MVRARNGRGKRMAAVRQQGGSRYCGPSAWRQRRVDQYFARKAGRYDEVSKQAFWGFSDDLLWGLLREKLLPRRPSQGFLLLDAGGGTGRWTARTLASYPNARAIVVDRSPAMLRQAVRNLARARCLDRVTLLERDIRAFPEVESDSVDFLYCFHNVLGFVCDAKRALAELRRVLRPGGRVALMFPNYCHALYFVCATGRLEEIERIRRSRHVKFADACPSVHLLLPWELPALLRSVGLASHGVHGFPVSLYPGQAETTARSSSRRMVQLLGNTKDREMLLGLERKLCADRRAAARGCNLIAFATTGKREGAVGAGWFWAAPRNRG